MAAKQAETGSATEQAAAPKAGRGRPRKTPVTSQDPAPTPAKRGRPRKEDASATSAAPSAQADEAVATPAKRGRPKSASKSELKEQVGDASGEKPTGETKSKSRSRSPKKSKKEPLKRAPTPRELEPPTGSRMLKLISVNVAGLRSVLAGDKAAELVALVKKEQPDVLCINEHKLKEDDLGDAEEKLRELLPKEYDTMHWTCSTAKKGYSGVAMILRQPQDGQPAAIADPASVSVLPGLGEARKDDPITSQEGRVLTMELPELTVVAAYVPNSGADLQRLSYRVDRAAEHCWDRAFAEYVCELRESRSKPVVVIGDLNCCNDVRDIWNMHERPDFPGKLALKPVEDQYVGLTTLKKLAGLTPEERSSFPQMLDKADLVDTFRALHPDATGVFSYFSQRAVQNRSLNRGLRLDYVLASSALCSHLKEGSGDELPCPRIHDSFILDEDTLIADHAAIGCYVMLPPA